MCGICGQIYFDTSRPAEREVVARMCDTLIHRGPDADGYYVSGPVALGSRRLAIIDVEGGRMPIHNEDQTIWIVYNGEVYNFPELRRALEARGHRFETHSDTETIVHLYEEQGDGFASSLNGMFALAIWDERRQRLVLARDHVGIKPLYYAVLEDRLVFGSEVKALLAAGVDRTLDPLALHDYLSLNYVPGPRSLFKAIRKLQPGHLAVLDLRTRRLSVSQYWDLPHEEESTSRPPRLETTEDDLLALLRQTVRDQMISDVPLGAFLSGGLDSSLVVALMSEVSNRPVNTFSLGFEEESYSELPYAGIVAQRFGTNHHELVMQPRAHELITAMSTYFDEPFADASALAVYAVSRLAADHVKVALSGDGGDELFGGYYTYQADRLAALYRRLPRALGAGLIPTLVDTLPVSDEKASLEFKLRRFMTGGSLPPLPAHYSWKAYGSEESKLRLYGSNGGARALRPSVDVLAAHYDAYATGDELNRLLYVDMKVQLVDDMLTKVDRMSMAHSLEVRVPLLDIRLVEFMARLPSSLKVRRLTLKYLLKRVARRVLPPEILARRKAGFSIPVAAWIKTDLRDMVCDYLSPRAVAAQGVFDPDAVQGLLDAHWRGERNHSHNIWALLMFSLWHENYAGPVRDRKPPLGLDATSPAIAVVSR